MKSSKKVLLGAVLALTAAASSSCSNSSGGNPANDRAGQNSQAGATAPATKLIRSDYAPGEVTQLCDAAISATGDKLNAIAAIPADQRTTDNTLLAFENVTADFGDDTNPLTFMGYVHTDKDISAEGSACEEKVGAFMVETFTRRDLYAAVHSAVARDADEKALKESMVIGFEKNGLKLDDAGLAQLKTILNQISSNEAKFSKNLNSDSSTVEFTLAELNGVPADFIARLDKKGANFIVVPNEATYPVFMQNATDSNARKKMMLSYLNRGGIAITQLLEATTKLRYQAAQLLGFASWDDYQLQGRMAESKDAALNFLTSLKDKLAQRNKEDLDQLLAYKKSVDPTATTLEQWDISWAQNQLKKRDYSVDEEAIREYFPADVVIPGMFKVYSQILGVTYKQVVDAKVWSPDVQLYEIRNTADDRLIGYFYADFFPRDGKYDHAAAFQQISGREINGVYNHTVSAIVANLTPPSPGKPSLLSHDDVETIFHEFGHIMHQTLTRAKFASLSGSNTAQDFVEAPSQMLENWVWSPEILPMLSGHYTDHSKTLPDEMLQKMLAARKFGQGIAYTKQLLYALFDMTIHGGQGETDVTATYDNLYRQIVGQEPIAGGHFAGTFGHMMGGYDAGYYGYLWSEVYAQDMFTKFEETDLLSPFVGARYRTTILERGGMTEALQNLKDFLGRDPSPDAFFKKLGI